ncbi:hypothetical protein [Pinibacter soli]|uniref:SGNH hydrolase-type esterase domain-containing protein n=1 Tax=Pinibacter soli TaxID=3044211 RepID=A0ABT6R8A1_9BACT|nr:hypothetical protein [Pinibacter soli]MDI3318790.1 hypothetical protein [Pinibacter soli]
MNNAKKVLLFTILASLSLSVFSLLPNIKTRDYTIKKIDLFSDIKKDTEKSATSQPSAIVPIDKQEEKKFDTYSVPGQIINFSAKTTQPALAGFIKKLVKVKKERKGKVRIAFFGDSMIEADLITQDLRSTLQQTFGGSGVGFVPVNDISASLRITVNSKSSNDWIKRNYKSENTDGLFISGNVFSSATGSWLSVKDNTAKDAVEISLLYGKGSGDIMLDNNIIQIPKGDEFNIKKLKIANSVEVKIQTPGMRVFGTSFESSSGVIVDNFSFRGISGVEINKLNDDLLAQINIKRPYDLIILEYGVNVLFRPNDTNFDWYCKKMVPSLTKIKKAFPEADILMISTGDRAFRKGDKWESGIGVPNLVKAQALMAFENHVSFFNLYETMGGKNSIVDWANSNPPLANKDYVHPNHSGAKKVAAFLSDAIMHEANKIDSNK